MADDRRVKAIEASTTITDRLKSDLLRVLRKKPRQWTSRDMEALAEGRLLGVL